MPGLFTTRLREGSWNCWKCGCGPIKGLIENSDRLIEKVCCTAQGNENLLESLLPSSFLIEGLKPAMMFIHDRLLRFQHETIDSGHRCLLFARLRQQGNRARI